MLMNPRKKNIASSLVLILFSMVFLVYTTRYPLENWENPGPAVFPLILGGILLVLAVWQLLHALWALKKTGDSQGKGPKIKNLKKFVHDNPGEAKVIYLTAMLILYILMMQWIGFFVSTFCLVILSSKLTEARDWGRPTLLAAGLCLFCYLLFEFWLKVSFPRGILF
jgi:putative tricarboxylic transport membrane protein